MAFIGAVMCFVSAAMFLLRGEEYFLKLLSFQIHSENQFCKGQFKYERRRSYTYSSKDQQTTDDFDSIRKVSKESRRLVVFFLYKTRYRKS